MSSEIPLNRFGPSSSALKAWVRALERTTAITSRPDHILPDVIDELAARFGDASALLSDGECLTFRTLAGRMNQYARWAIACGVGKGETIALLMANRPEYMAIWLGICRAGCGAALLNNNLQGRSLAHSIDLAVPRHIIVAADLFERFTSAEPHLEHRPKVWLHGDKSSALGIDTALADLSGEPLRSSERREISIRDRALYIYTSGTTGLPKAANVSHERLMVWSHWFA